jgi:hypothetical protein
MKHHIQLGSLAALTTLLLAWNAAAKPNPVNSQAAAAAHAALIAELQQINGLLTRAKHDYEGHRAAAVNQVHKAIHALQHHIKAGAAGQPAKASNPTTTGIPAQPANVGNANKEPQAESDTQLKEALTGLKTVHSQLTSLPQGLKHKLAEEHIRKAIHELHTALKIK